LFSHRWLRQWSCLKHIHYFIEPRPQIADLDACINSIHLQFAYAWVDNHTSHFLRPLLYQITRAKRSYFATNRSLSLHCNINHKFWTWSQTAIIILTFACASITVNRPSFHWDLSNSFSRDLWTRMYASARCTCTLHFHKLRSTLFIPRNRFGAK
jgi:hypothetical protein